VDELASKRYCGGGKTRQGQELAVTRTFRGTMNRTDESHNFQANWTNTERDLSISAIWTSSGPSRAGKLDLNQLLFS
jgi:hypothetical protein